MSKKNKQVVPQLPISAPTQPSPAVGFAPLRMRIGAGKHAVKATEVEIVVDGSRIAGGNGIVEFDLFAETWVDIRVTRA